MPQNRLKHFPTAILRRGMAHFRPALPVAGYLPPIHRRLLAEVEAGGPWPVEPPDPAPVEVLERDAEPALMPAA